MHAWGLLISRPLCGPGSNNYIALLKLYPGAPRTAAYVLDPLVERGRGCAGGVRPASAGGGVRPAPPWRRWARGWGAATRMRRASTCGGGEGWWGRDGAVEVRASREGLARAAGAAG